MCGLAGALNLNGAAPERLDEIGNMLSGSLAHRGPDAMAWWADPAAGFVLAHTRLAIIDLSNAGAQPMVSACGRWVIAYNGEIYNAPEVARDLPHITWRGHSDTEVLLEACATWGIESAVPRFIGMFAFALWDRKERRLYLARDRVGIKPLYYGRNGDIFAFASELRSIAELFQLGKADLAEEAVNQFLQLSYVPAPLSIFKGIYKLLPGHILCFDRGSVDLHCYWNIRSTALNGLRNKDKRAKAEIENDLHGLLLDSVRRRMIADVPLGSLLSGGIDSSLVTSLMQAQSGMPIRTFSIGFEESAYNEAGFARAVASHLGTDHREVTVTAPDALAIVPDLPDLFDEPFADASQMPTILLSRLVRKDVKVALSGDGGDELFSGYSRYFRHASWDRWIRLAPATFRKSLASTIEYTASRVPAELISLASRAPEYARLRLTKFAAVFGCADLDASYSASMRHWRCKLPENSRHAFDGGGFGCGLGNDFDAISRMRYADMITYLPDDVLAKVDRASMSVGLEVRVPLLDHRILEMCWAIPGEHMIRTGGGKHMLRSILSRYVPERLFERPKMGFGVPVGDWLRGPLRGWAEDLLSESGSSVDYLKALPVRAAWAEHKRGYGNWGQRLWTILMLQAWLRRWCR